MPKSQLNHVGIWDPGGKAFHNQVDLASLYIGEFLWKWNALVLLAINLCEIIGGMSWLLGVWIELRG